VAASAETGGEERERARHSFGNQGFNAYRRSKALGQCGKKGKLLKVLLLKKNPEN